MAYDSSEDKTYSIFQEDVAFEEYMSMDNDVVISAPGMDIEMTDEIRRDRNITLVDDLHYSSETDVDEEYIDSDTGITTEAFNALKTIR